MDAKTVGLIAAAIGLVLLLRAKDAEAGELDRDDDEPGPSSGDDDAVEDVWPDTPENPPTTPKPKVPPKVTPVDPVDTPDKPADGAKIWDNLFPVIPPKISDEPTTWEEVEPLIEEYPTQGKYYRVRWGDSLSRIAQWAGMGGTNWKSIEQHPRNAWALANQFAEGTIKLYARYDAPGWNTLMRAKTRSDRVYPVIYVPKVGEA